MQPCLPRSNPKPLKTRELRLQSKNSLALYDKGYVECFYIGGLEQVHMEIEKRGDLQEKMTANDMDGQPDNRIKAC